MPKFTDRLQHAWDAFRGRDHPDYGADYGPGYSTRPDKNRLIFGKYDRSIVTAIFNRIAMDAASAGLRHVRQDENGRYIETIKDGLNNCLTVEANMDQTARAFMQDMVLSMMDEGVVAVVPTETSVSPIATASFDIRSMRTGKIVQWYPKYVRVRLYNDHTGRQEELTLPKSMVAIIENPLYSVINGQNSTLQRLIRKLNLLDIVDEQASSGKLDMIIQLPYVVKSDARKQQAEERRKNLEDQLKDSKYGVAYMDATEKITQLNRPLENNLMGQIEYLMKLLYSQLGLPEDVFNGTADQAAMLNYNNRTLEPILSAISDEFSRKFLTKTARTQGHAIAYFREPFKLVPLGELGNVLDVLMRNAVLTGNEARAILGYRPADDQNADQLLNRNLPFEDQMGGDALYPGNQQTKEMMYPDDASMNQPVEQTPGMQ